MASEQEVRVLNRVLEMLGSGNALSQDLEDYIVAYHTLGNICSAANGVAERLELETKVAWAEAFSLAKQGENKASDAMAKAQADIAVQDMRLKEIAAREKVGKIKSTLESTREAIWAIKYLGKQGG